MALLHPQLASKVTVSPAQIVVVVVLTKFAAGGVARVTTTKLVVSSQSFPLKLLMVTRRNRVDSVTVLEKEYPTEVTLVRVHGSVAGF